MVKIAIAAATSLLAREVLDKLVETEKHEIIAISRKDPTQLPSLPGVTWVQTTYQDKQELVQLFQDVHTVLCFITVHADPGSETQKRVIDAAVEAGVKRFAPSEYATGVALETHLEASPWFAGKVEVAHYLQELNKDKKVLEYTRFQPGGFMDYLGHPHRVTKHAETLGLHINIEKCEAVLVEGSLDDEMTFTSINDIANVVVRAVEFEGDWPPVGGISGTRITQGELLRLAEKVRGKKFSVDWLKMEDLEAGDLKTDRWIRPDLPSTPAGKEEYKAFSKMVTIGMMRSMRCGSWTTTDEWNRLLSDYKFTTAEEFMKMIWADK